MNIEKLDLEKDVIKINGYDDCIVGIGYRIGIGQVLIYDTDTIVKKLMKDNISHEEAYEYMEFNMISAYVGEKTPIFLFRNND
jgi:hypothetical protein